MNTQLTTTRLDVSDELKKESKMNTIKSILIKSGLVLLAALAIALVASWLSKPVEPVANASPTSALVYDATGAMNEAIVLPSSVQMVSGKSALVYDATGAMNGAVALSSEVRPASSKSAFVYDATAAMQDVVVQSWEVQSAPSKLPVFYDATAEMLKSIVLP